MTYLSHEYQRVEAKSFREKIMIFFYELVKPMSIIELEQTILEKKNICKVPTLRILRTLVFGHFPYGKEK